MKPYIILGIVQPGLEDLACQELEQLGITKYFKLKGGVEFVGHQSALIKCNLMCRIFSRFVIRLDSFIATTFRELDAKLNNLPWNYYIVNQKVCFHINSVSSKLYHEKAIAMTLIAFLNKACKHEIEIVGSPDEPDTQLVIVNVKNNQFTISLDSSGIHLHKRGYMPWREKAPLRETTASAMLRCIPDSDKPIIDPMCGAGTILIEKAVQAKKQPLSLFRDFTFQNWSLFQEDTFKQVEAFFMEKVIENPRIVLKGSDIDEKSIKTCKFNAESAGVSDIIDFEVKDIADYLGTLKRHIIVTNPPYGVRVKGVHLIGKLTKLASKNEVYFLHPLKHRTGDTLFTTNNGAITVHYQKIR
ncbi:MAG: hypothetical protein JXR56_02910 [Candidatus Cloacimonetes bacterium]|nr:hypothetical protein [Candidatus Cloacimonadota bacterium]